MQPHDVSDRDNESENSTAANDHCPGVFAVPNSVMLAEAGGRPALALYGSKRACTTEPQTTCQKRMMRRSRSQSKSRSRSRTRRSTRSRMRSRSREMSLANGKRKHTGLWDWFHDVYAKTERSPNVDNNNACNSRAFKLPSPVSYISPSKSVSHDSLDYNTYLRLLYKVRRYWTIKNEICVFNISLSQDWRLIKLCFVIILEDFCEKQRGVKMIRSIPRSMYSNQLIVAKDFLRLCACNDT